MGEWHQGISLAREWPGQLSNSCPPISGTVTTCHRVCGNKHNHFLLHFMGENGTLERYLEIWVVEMVSDSSPWECLGSVVQVSTGLSGSSKEGSHHLAWVGEDPLQERHPCSGLRDCWDSARWLIASTKETTWISTKRWDQLSDLVDILCHGKGFGVDLFCQ